MSRKNDFSDKSATELRDLLKVKVDFEKAACLDTNPVVMDGETRRDVISAKRICSICPVAQECGKWAIWHEPSGIWGGMTPVERKTMRGGLILVDLIEINQKIEVLENLNSQKSIRELADEYQVTERTIYRWRA